MNVKSPSNCHLSGMITSRYCHVFQLMGKPSKTMRWYKISSTSIPVDEILSTKKKNDEK